MNERVIDCGGVAPKRRAPRVIPLVPVSKPAAGARTQRQRTLAQIGFFVLFVAAPLFDLLRYDLTLGHAFFLGMPWQLGIDDFLAGRIGPGEAAANILLRLFLPILAAGGLLIWAAWRWGRLYCGWLCPHFSVVETINRLMLRASGKQSVWDSKPIPARRADGSTLRFDRRWWFAVVPFAVFFAFLWAVVLLTYLMPPLQIYDHLLRFALTRNEALFIGAATAVLSLEFLFARHLFCRFACAVGLFQSLAWMSNRRAMVVSFARGRAADCARCYAASGPGYSACEGVCPMRLKPRNVKQFMFACTQCGQCIDACGTVQRESATLLKWVQGEAARQAEAPVSLTGRRDG
jgi:polyferredoxin